MNSQTPIPRDEHATWNHPVAQLYADLLDAWNQQNADGFAALFAPDGNTVGFDGSQLDGRDAIQASLRQIFADHKTARYVHKIREIRNLAPQVVLLRAIVGMVPPGKRELMPARNAIQSLVAVESAGAWHIALFQNTPAVFDGRPALVQQMTAELSELV